MRDKIFIAQHRGGELTLQHHQFLMNWAISCAEHVYHLVEENFVINDVLTHALFIAKEWEAGIVKTGKAMKAAYVVHTLARDTESPILKSIARSIGQAVSTAHMADHSLGASLYALKAIKLAGGSVVEEIAWQDRKLDSLPPEMIDLVKETRFVKKQAFRDLRD